MIGSAGSGASGAEFVEAESFVEEGAAVEEVQFLRDDMAAMAWAVENQLQGDLDAPVDGHEAYLRWLQLNPAPAPPTQTP